MVRAMLPRTGGVRLGTIGGDAVAEAFHVVFVVTWFAGLFYLPRLFVYHAAASEREGLARFVVMERRLFLIMSRRAARGAVRCRHDRERARISDPGLDARQLCWSRRWSATTAVLPADAGAARRQNATRSAGTACSTSCRGCCCRDRGARGRQALIYQILTRSSD